MMSKLPMAIAVHLGLIAGTLQAVQDAPGPSETAARAFLGLLAKEDFAAATKDFDEAMLKAMPQDKLADLWKILNKEAGPFQKLDKARLEKKGDLEAAVVTCIFANVNLDARVVFKDKKITGLFFALAKSAVAYTPPPYVARDAFHEIDVTVGTGEWAVKGSLSIPNGAGPFPAVVFCQGSGPNDRDETIGPNKPLKDIAWGLSSRGIAVLRFDKRFHTHGAKFAAIADKITVKEEVIDDIYSAVALLKGARTWIRPAFSCWATAWERCSARAWLWAMKTSKV